MQFDKTKTYLNLARAFAGESQAGMRYQLIAGEATKQGYMSLADEIRVIAKNETVHARRFFEELTKRGSKLDNIVLDAGYPFHTGDLCRSLLLAAEDEKSENREIYPAFARDAKEEGYGDVSALFNMVAEVERHHEQIFTYLGNAMKEGTLYKNDSPILYVCTECGHKLTSTEAWDICPLCKSSQGYVALNLPYGKEKI